MHLVYVDDSGDSKNGTTMTALLIENRNWNGVLDFWLQGRRQFIAILKCPKHRKFTQIISNKGRANHRDSEEVNRSLSSAKRAAVGRNCCRGFLKRMA